MKDEEEKEYEKSDQEEVIVDEETSHEVENGVELKEEKSETVVSVKLRSRTNSLKAERQNLALTKKSGEKTLIEIIEDTRSGVPAKSELESKVCLIHLIDLGEEGIALEKKERCERKFEGWRK